MPADDNEGPAEGREPMDETEVRRTLGVALTLQSRSLLEMTLLAGAMRGLGGVGTKAQLRQFVQHELEDTYLLTEKLAAVGDSPTHADQLYRRAERILLDEAASAQRPVPVRL